MYQKACFTLHIYLIHSLNAMILHHSLWKALVNWIIRVLEPFSPLLCRLSLVMLSKKRSCLLWNHVCLLFLQPALLLLSLRLIRGFFSHSPRVHREFAQLYSDELVLGQRLPRGQQRLPPQPEHGQGWAEGAALLPWRWHPGEKQQSRGPGFNPGTIYLQHIAVVLWWSSKCISNLLSPE